MGEVDRKFGSIPMWAKAGPISRKNYDYRAELHGFLKQWADTWPFLSSNKELPGTANEHAWERYFTVHLGGYPTTFRMFRSGALTYLNMPEATPELFDSSYVQSKLYQ